MICQEELISKIDSLNSLPHSILLLGDQGAGHLDVCKYIANKNNLFFIKLEEITQELISKMYLSAELSLYAIDLTILDERKQNMLLKIFEEPCAYTYIVLYGESEYGILETIINRSYMLKMCKYSTEYLKSIARDESCVEYCTTPGQVDIANHTDLNKLKSLCNIILTQLSKADVFNALHIADKINFKDEYNKFDLRLFIKLLRREMIAINEYNFIDLLSNFEKNVIFMTDKKRYFQHFILLLWKAERGVK